RGHPRLNLRQKKGVDGRDKPGHVGIGWLYRLMFSRNAGTQMRTVLDKVVAALKEFYAREAFLFANDLGERTLTHRLAVQIERQFADFEVDCDFDRLGP